jgi:hypothetical protein
MSNEDAEDLAKAAKLDNERGEMRKIKQEFYHGGHGGHGDKEGKRAIEKNEERGKP